MQNASVTITFVLAMFALGQAIGGIDYIAYPKYSFDYKVTDPHTGDIKEQWEKRDGDKVLGQYQLNDPDGTIRVVKYSADDHSGFNARVERLGHAIHPIPIRLAKWDWDNKL